MFNKINTNIPLEITGCKITQAAKSYYNTHSDMEFLRKFSCSKATYAKRVMRYGDPYMKSPLAIIGKILSGKSILE